MTSITMHEIASDREKAVKKISCNLEDYYRDIKSLINHDVEIPAETVDKIGRRLRDIETLLHEIKTI